MCFRVLFRGLDVKLAGGLIPRRQLALTLILLLSACAPPERPTLAPPTTLMPTLAVETYVESAAPISIANVEQIVLLGRLDQPSTPSTIFAHAVSPDSTRLVGLSNEQVLGWDLLTGALVFQTARVDGTQAFYASDKTEIYVINTVGGVSVYDGETGAVRYTFAGHPQYGGIFAFDGENDRLALGGSDGTVKIWDLFERTALATLNAHTAPITVLSFSTDGERLATAGADFAVRVWDWRGRTLTAETSLAVPVTGTPSPAVQVRRLAFAPAAEQLAIGTSADVRLWDYSSTTPPSVLGNDVGSTADILMYAPTGEALVSGAGGGGLAVWNSLTNTSIGQLPEVGGSRTDVAFSGDGSLLLTSSLEGTVSLWNLGGASGSGIGRANLDATGTRVFAAEWTPDGRLLLLFDAAGPVYAWGVGA